MPKGFKGFQKGMIPTLGCFKKGHTRNCGRNHPNWKGGISIGQFLKPYYNRYSKQYNKHIKEKLAGRKRPEQCEICGSLGKICFDHDHITNKFRGWICLRCNVALGMVKDNSETLMALADYIKRSKANN